MPQKLHLSTQNWLPNFYMQRKIPKLETVHFLYRKRAFGIFGEFYAKAKIPRLEKLTHCNIWDFTKLV